MDKITPPIKHWQKIELYIDPDAREILRTLTYSKEIFLSVKGVSRLTALPLDDTCHLVSDLEEAGWLTYSYKATDLNIKSEDRELYVGLSERVARRQLVARKFNQPKYANNTDKSICSLVS